MSESIVQLIEKLQAGITLEISPNQLELVGTLLEISRSADPIVLRRARLSLGKLDSQELQNELCLVAMKNNDTLAADICVAAQYEPINKTNKCVFFLMCGLWDDYRLLDPSGNTLLSSYAYLPVLLRQHCATGLRVAYLQGNPIAVTLISLLAAGCTAVMEIDCQSLSRKDVLSSAITLDDPIFETLKCIEKSEDRNKVCQTWAVTRSTPLARFLSDQKWIASEPEKLRILCLLNAGLTGSLREADSATVKNLVDLCTADQLYSLQEQAFESLMNLSSSEAKETLCWLAVIDRNPVAQTILKKVQYHPSSENDKALFHFLMGDFLNYERIDVDHSIMASMYQTADSKVRNLIHDLLKNMGRPDFINSILGHHQKRILASLSSEEWETLADSTTKQELWQEMWSLAQSAPLSIAVRLLRRLRIVGWEPAQQGDRDLFKELADAAVKCKAPVPRGDQFKLPLVDQQPCSDDLTCMDVAEDQLFTGSSDGAISAWTKSMTLVDCRRLHSPQPIERLLVNSNQSFGISTDANGRTIHWSLLDRTPLKVWKLPSGCCALNPQKPIAGSANGNTISLVEFGTNAKEMRNGYLVEKEIIQLPPIGPFKGSVDCLAFSDDGTLLASGNQNGEISLNNLATKRQEFNCLQHKARVLGIGFFNNRIVSVSRAGQLAAKILVHQLDGTLINTLINQTVFDHILPVPLLNGFLTFGKQTPTILRDQNGNALQEIGSFGNAIAVSGNGHHLYAYSEHTLFKYSISGSSPFDMPVAAIEESQLESLLQSPSSPWLEMRKKLVNVRKRFDIELEQATALCGQTDIDIG